LGSDRKSVALRKRSLGESWRWIHRITPQSTWRARRQPWKVNTIDFGFPTGGDYLIPAMQLRPGVGDAGASGFSLHLNGSEAAD
jgi:hypothetical protein